MPMARTWEGLTLEARVHRAAGRAIVAIAVNVAVETKRITHVQFGTLRRSIHAAEPDYDGERDATDAQVQDLLVAYGTPSPAATVAGPAIEVGSWMPYACVEWVGRGHPGITQGLESVRGAQATAIVVAAFKEEGL